MAGTGSEAGVRKVLGRLVEQGLVHVSEAGASLLYVANRDHVAWPAAEWLATLRRLLFDRIAAAITGWEIKPMHASVFGSTARGDGDTRSDIDLFVIRPARTAEDSEPWASQIDHLRDAVAKWTGNPCQVFQLDMNRLAEHAVVSDRLLDEWCRDAITLYGDEPRNLMSRAKRQGPKGRRQR
ncbi:MAG: nucleotidyltransferase domain-containing protein [Mycobacteriales bacterium]